MQRPKKEQEEWSRKKQEFVSIKYTNDERVFNEIVAYENRDSDEFKSLRAIADKYGYPYHRVTALKKRYTLGLPPAHLTACAAVVQKNIIGQIEVIDRRQELSEFLMDTQYLHLKRKHEKGEDLSDIEKKNFRDTITAYIQLMNSIEGSKSKFSISDSNVVIINSKVEFQVNDELRKVLLMLCPDCQGRVIRRMGRMDGDVIDVEVSE